MDANKEPFAGVYISPWGEFKLPKSVADSVMYTKNGELSQINTLLWSWVKLQEDNAKAAIHA